MTEQRHGTCNQASEWGYSSGKRYEDPFNEIELDVLFTDPQGVECRVPAFWAGLQEWRVRFAPRLTGTYNYRTVCTDETNEDLHGQKGTLEVAPYAGENPLLSHGPLRVSEDKRFLEHMDGTPFFWLRDTWWMALCKRLAWPEEFQALTADRKEKGFSVVQLVAGPYPDMPAFDPRNENEAGHPWEPEWRRVNPAYYDQADRRIQLLVRSELVPCILGCWGYYVLLMGVEKMKKHFRNLIARYGAYPIVWCLAGEAAMPYYLTETRKEDVAKQKKDWTEIARYVRETDPYHHPITIHPTQVGRDQVEAPSVLDFDMLQTGHEGRDSIPNTQQLMRAAVAREPRMPVINGEVCYEGIFEDSWANIQRFMFWSCMLSGACGHTYGANGIWQVNAKATLYGPSPWGGVWGNRLWEDAAQLPGAAHLGVGRQILQCFEWWRFEPHSDWIEPSADDNAGWRQPYAAGIPGRVRVFYLPKAYPGYNKKGRPRVQVLEDGYVYKASYVDPKDAEEYPIGQITGDAQGNWEIPPTPICQDWLLVLERE